jgi:hypothetical protein
MRKTLITLALIAAPVLAAAQQPAAKPTQTPAAAHDTSKVKAKPKATRHAAAPKKATRTSRDTTKAKAATPDTSKKPN